MAQIPRFLLPLILLLNLVGSSAISQEYLKPVIIKPDSVSVGTLQLLNELRARSAARSNEWLRNYRDSLSAAIEKARPGIGKTESLQAAIPSKAGPFTQMQSDLAWNNFLVAADKTGNTSLLKFHSGLFPKELNMQGNVALMYEILGQYDSAEHVINDFKLLMPSGFTSLDIEKNILVFKKDSLHITKIINLQADSFKVWVTDKLFQYPANPDSLRSALATVLSHRTGAFPVPDKVIGQLIVDFADLTIKNKDYQLGLPFYDIALIYDPQLQKLVSERKQVILELEKSITSTFQWASIIYAVPLLAFVIIIVGWIRNRAKV